MPRWKNVTPRLGVSYDLFGNGKTAVKFSIGKYLEAPNPPTFTRVGESGRRPRAERHADVDRSQQRLRAAGERARCAQPDQLRHHRRQLALRRRCADEPDVQLGAGGADSARDRARECRSTSAISGGGTATCGSPTTCRSTPADYSPYCVTAPLDSRLPGGGGYPVSGLYDVNRLVGQNNVISLASKFGERDRGLQRRRHHGERPAAARASSCRAARASAGWRPTTASPSTRRRARPAAGQGATSAAGLLYCDVKPPFQPNVKLIGVYPLPWGGIQLAATFQSLPGRKSPPAAPTPTPRFCRRSAATWRPARPARRSCRSSRRARCTTNGSISSTSARRRSSGSARAACRRTWISTTWRTPARFWRINKTYGANWLRPTSVLQGRLLKFGAQFDF